MVEVLNRMRGTSSCRGVQITSRAEKKLVLDMVAVEEDVMSEAVIVE